MVLVYNLELSFMCRSSLSLEFYLYTHIYLNFRLRQVLLQSEEELMVKQNSELSSEGVAPKQKKLIGKMKVQG